MPNALGKIFYQSKKFPIPIKVSSLGSPKELSLVTLKTKLIKLYLVLVIYHLLVLIFLSKLVLLTMILKI